MIYLLQDLYVSLNQNDMTDLQDKAATMDTEGMSGYTTPNPKRTTEIPT